MVKGLISDYYDGLRVNQSSCLVIGAVLFTAYTDVLTAHYSCVTRKLSVIVVYYDIK